MKHAIYTLALCAALSAHADPFADTDNQAGGKITLMTEQCENSKDSRAFFYTQDGQTEDGCWRYDGNTVVVTWEKTGRRRYPISYFKLLNQFSKFRTF